MGVNTIEQPRRFPDIRYGVKRGSLPELRKPVPMPDVPNGVRVTMPELKKPRWPVA